MTSQNKNVLHVKHQLEHHGQCCKPKNMADLSFSILIFIIWTVDMDT